VSVVQHIDPSVAVEVTEAARLHFRQQIRNAGVQGIRISVKESGCTGFMYVVDLVEQAQSGDIALGEEHDPALFIDPAALKVLRGTRIDYVREGLNSVLRFENPNAQDYCGCGESFNLKDNAG
jgi:iron-sulfur cluster assembly accessory protein